MEEKGRENGSGNAETSKSFEGLRRKPGSLKRKASNSSFSTSSKRFAKEKIPILPPLHNGPCTRARQSPNKLAAAAATPQNPPVESLQPPPPPEKTAGEETAIANESSREDEDRLDFAMDAEFEAIRSRDANAHVVPAHAGWFSWTKVHALEERSLASFFNGKSENRTSDVYLEIRNLIMKKYHTDPQTKIVLADLSELSAGDSDARQEVMEFLDHWGLINFHPFPPSDTSTPSVNVNGNADTDSLMEKLYKFEKLEACSRIGLKGSSSASAAPPRLVPESSIPDDLVRPPEGPAVEYHCNSCSADCSRKRYHCQKQADFDLCTDCYNAGKFGSGMAPTDFILMEPATENSGVSGGSWTDQETLLLLEALELYGENWNEIAEHVATKTKTQCILHFVQMQIEDAFLEGKEPFDTSVPGKPDLGLINKDPSALKAFPESPTIKTAAMEEQQPVPSPTEVNSIKEAVEVELAMENGASFAAIALKTAFQAVGALPRPGGSLSFADAGNPVMTLAAFLAALVDPSVAAASARSMLKAMSEDSPGIQLATRHCFLLEDPPKDQKDPPANESSVNDKGNAEVEKEENQLSIPKCDDTSKDVTDKNDSEKPQTPVFAEESQTAEKETPMLAEEPQTAEKEAPMLAEESQTTKDSEEPQPAKDSENHQTAKESEEPHTANGSEEPQTVDGSKEPAAAKESEELATVGEVQPIPETSKTMEISSDPAPSEEKEVQHTVVPDPMIVSDLVVEGGEKTGENGMKVTDSTGDKIDDSSSETKDHNLDRLKRAALVALSAACVKAKLLANQEEEQIRQLISMIIEKQLHKLETKLGMFNEIEGVIMQIKEQIDRARQRVFNERNQIIAARLGLPASMSRGAPVSSSQPKISANTANTVASKITPTVTFPSNLTGSSIRGLSRDGFLSTGSNLVSESKTR